MMMRLNSIKKLECFQKTIQYSMNKMSTSVGQINKSPLPAGDVKDMSIDGLDTNAVKAFVQELFVKKPEERPTELGRWKVETDNFSKSYSYDHGVDLSENEVKKNK